ncbi:hypothetical protein [Aeromonas rivipollensis]|uniref:hypothetical protein n=1 Tax=Aeromonas rivipollensis TaxID=948519 RepID=UPI003D1A952F
MNPTIDQICFASAVIATDKKQKWYETNRVAQIFDLVIQPKHCAFRGSLPTRICSDSDIEASIAAHNNAEDHTKNQSAMAEQRMNDEILHEAYLASLIGVRQTLRNTTRGTYYLLPEGIYSNGFLNYDELRELPLRARMVVMKNSSEVDRFLVEPVSKFSYHLLDLSLEEIE